MPIGTDAFVQNFVAKTCRDIIDDVKKLDAIQDRLQYSFRKLSVHFFVSIVSGSDEGHFQRLSPLVLDGGSVQTIAKSAITIISHELICMRQVLDLEDHRRSYNNCGQDCCDDTCDVSDSRRNGAS